MKEVVRKKNETSKEFAFRSLKENIMNLQLEPGRNLSESEIAEWYELSRTPVREVIMKLKDAHLIEVVPQKGTYISLIDLDLVREGIFVRSILEKEVLKKACDGIDECYIKELAMNIFEYEYIVDDKDAKTEKHNLDKKFHQIIFDSVGMSNIWESIQKLSTHYNRVRLLSELEKSDRNILEQHKKILGVIKDRNKSEVDELVRIHIEDPVCKWKELYADKSDYKSFFNI